MGNIKRYLCIALLFLPTLVHAVDLTQVELNEDDYLLLSVMINKESARVTVDSYDNNGQLYVAIEPLLNGLKLRYQLRQDQLTVWKEDEEHTFSFLSTSTNDVTAQNTWATDGYYQYISQDVLETLFDVSFEIDRPRLMLNLITQNYKFPITLLAEQTLLRSSIKANSYAFNQPDSDGTAIPITIPDQYNLFTMPHGDIRSSIDYSDNNEKIQTNVQLVSDLLYHSARLSLNHTAGQNITGGLSLSRYKTSPNARILGAFDRYRFGDISSSLGAGVIGGTSGVGLLFERQPEGYRRSNSKIDIEQDATPGWEAELFLNGRFIAADTVPDTGLLIFEDVDIYYGSNEFQIKVYGPFAEIETYQLSYPLIANPLADGEMAYNIHALDNTRSLFNNSSQSGGLEINSVGGAFDYGFNDMWQIGLTFQDRMQSAGNQQLFSLHNYVNFPGFLLENELAFNADADFAQQTNLSGNIWGGAAFQLRYESNHDLDINDNNSFSSINFERLTASYANNWGNVPLIFRASYADVGETRTYTLSNNVYFNYQRLRFSHDVYFSRIEQEIDGSVFGNNYITGNLGISGQLFKDFRLSANLNYDPQGEDVVLDSSFLNAQYTWLDPFSYRHYFNFSYRPLGNKDNTWQLSHNLAYETSDYRLSFNSRYDAQDQWSIGLNVNFFLGYDYHNQRALTSSTISAESATLNVHSYLDRQLNGVSDVLDYDLEGVEFQGLSEWQGLKSGEGGEVILPGVPVNTPFSFGATWKRGSKTINNDYVIYTHPGARIDVNMPFYLNTELAGFVYRNAKNGEVAVNEIIIDLIDSDNNVVEQKKTDSDGYFEFVNMQPSSYKVAINEQDLRDKGLTTELRGYSLSTPSVGGFTELPVLYVRQLKSDDDRAAEAISELILSEDDIELLVWDEDNEKRQNYFTLPTKQKIMASHSQTNTAESEVDNNQLTDADQNAVDKVAETKVGIQGPAVVNQTQPNSQVASNQFLHQNTQSNLISNNFTIQLGAFVNFDTAESIAKDFESRFPIQTNIIKTQNQKWQNIYKVYVGSFAQRSQASTFAERFKLKKSEYLITSLIQGEIVSQPAIQLEMLPVEPVINTDSVEKENSTSSADTVLDVSEDFQGKEWVIQFYASQSKISANEAQPFKAIGDVFMAQKQGKTPGEVWYCLISIGFETKAQAEQAMRDANVRGWINQSQLYSSAVKIK